MYCLWLHGFLRFGRASSYEYAFVLVTWLFVLCQCFVSVLSFLVIPNTVVPR